MAHQMDETVAALTAPGKGLLAADESTGTIEKRFKALGIPCTEDTRRSYREMLFTTNGLGEFISGVILYEETLRQKADDGRPLPQVLVEQGIVPGIKVDKGTVALAHFPGDKLTQGLDGLAGRLAEYRPLGARFAKWRAVFTITDDTPSAQAIERNADALALYAAYCQEQSIVPIVEPEVLMDGDHTIERCAYVTQEVLAAVFHALHRQRVVLEHMLLKPSMVIAGKDCAHQAAPSEVADYTLRCFRRTVPAAVPSINFLSGGQPDEAATANLNAMHGSGVTLPWNVSFSYSRALQSVPMATWKGNAAHRSAAQLALYRRARLNSLAQQGQYASALETQAT